MAVSERLQATDSHSIKEIIASLTSFLGARAAQFLEAPFGFVSDREFNRELIRSEGGVRGKLITYDGDDIPLHYGRPSNK